MARNKRDIRRSPISKLNNSARCPFGTSFFKKTFKGQGGITIYNALLFYTIFIFLIVYLSSIAGVAVLQTNGNPSNIQPPTNFIDPFQVIGFYIALATTTSTYTLITVILLAPFAAMMIYAILQLIRGT